MRPRTLIVAAGAVLVIAMTVFVASGGNGATSAAPEPEGHTVQVKEGKLSAMVSLDGILTYRAGTDGSPYSAINQASGTYTELPGTGDEVDAGDVLYRVDDDPVLMLRGTVPAYRDLNEGDEGHDVRQLNRNLRRLGYDAEAAVDIDPHADGFNWETEAALEKLQDDKGLDESGELGIEDAIFLPRSARISKVTGELGGSARPGAQVAQATSDTLEVQADLEAFQQGAVKEDDLAQITLPGNVSVKGKVGRVGRVASVAAEGDEAGAAVIPVFISLDEPAEASHLDRAPVGVNISTRGVRDALSVPVTALVGRSGGGFAVEVVRDGGERELVAVDLGLFDTAAGRVQVEGDLGEGDRVVVPSP